jgi:hypothetical protein
MAKRNEEIDGRITEILEVVDPTRKNLQVE